MALTTIQAIAQATTVTLDLTATITQTVFTNQAHFRLLALAAMHVVGTRKYLLPMLMLTSIRMLLITSVMQQPTKPIAIGSATMILTWPTLSPTVIAISLPIWLCRKW